MGMNCLLYVDDANLLVGCQSGQLASVDLSSMQVTSQVLLFLPLSQSVLGDCCRWGWRPEYVYSRPPRI